MNGVSRSSSSEVSKNAIDALRAASRSPLKHEHQVHTQIGEALQIAETENPDNTRSPLQQWIYTLAVIYTHQTGLLPGFSNCENETRFERFVHAIPTSSGLWLTRNKVKAAIRHLRFKSDVGFARDVEALNKQSSDAPG